MSGIHQQFLESKLGCGIKVMTAEEWLDCACKLDEEARDYLTLGDTDLAQRTFADSRLNFQAAVMKEALERR